MDYEATIEEVAATGPFGDLPLVVLTPEDWGAGAATPPWTPETLVLWHRVWTDELSPDLATLSTASTFIIVERATHPYIAEHAAVAEAIQQVVEEVRAQGN